MGETGNHSTQQLAEFLAAVSACPDAESAMQRGVERAAEALDADIAALVRHDQVVTAIGLAEEPDLHRAVLELARRSTTVDAGEFGPCTGISVALEPPSETRLVVVRLGSTRFRPEEGGLIRAMGRVLSLTLGLLGSLESERQLRIESERHAADNARLAASLERRRQMLEAASEIERAISRRAPLQEVLDAVIHAARDLLHTEPVALWVRDPEDPEYMRMLSSLGFDPELAQRVHRTPIGVGAGGRAIAENKLIVVDDYGGAHDTIEPIALDGVTSAMAAPVHDNGEFVGSLVVGSRNPGHVYTSEQQEILLTFAEHTSLALTDARTVERMNEAMHDPLTGLPNRAVLLDRISASAEAEGTETGAVVLFVDLDRFKLINDSFGHSFGDRLLVAVAARLLRHLRPEDTVARLGGDEFVVLLTPGATLETAAEVADRLLDSLHSPFMIEDRELFITASIGIAAGREEPAELVARADLAMYRAKRNGNPRHAVYAPSMRAAAVERLELEAALQSALTHQEFMLHYQPIVALANGEIVGFEALLRWRRPGRGIVPPAAFVPLAEESGLIIPIGRWVIEHACGQLAAWRKLRGDRRLIVSINLSGTQLAAGTLVQDLEETLARHLLAPRDVTLEITESVLVDETDARLAKLAELGRLGVRLAIDDFGTGYSSLSYVRRLDVDVLKIAKPLVEGVADNPKDRAVAGAIVELGRSLGLMLVAEGIERTEQAAALRRLGCTHGQGFHFAPPLDLDGARELVVRPGIGPVFLPQARWARAAGL